MASRTRRLNPTDVQPVPGRAAKILKRVFFGPEAAIIKELLCEMAEVLVESKAPERTHNDAEEHKAPAARDVSEKGRIDWVEFFRQLGINPLEAGELFNSKMYGVRWTDAYVAIKNEYTRTPHRRREPGKVPRPETAEKVKDETFWSDLFVFVSAILIRVGLAYVSAKLTFYGLSWFLF